MRKALKWRFYCDFCTRKASGRKDVMVKHERGCTMNPARICGVCAMLEKQQRTISKLLDALPDHAALRALADDCPACILAAYRQYNKGCAADEQIWSPDFDFKAEMKSVWDDINDARQERESVHY